MKPDERETMLVPRKLLQAARDYIGKMPTAGPDGQDLFFEALRIVEPIEKLLNADDEPVSSA